MLNMEWLGIAAGILTTGSFAPQAVKILRTRKVQDISLFMYIAFVSGVALWIAYGLAIGSASLVLANVITFLLAGSILVMKIFWGRSPSRAVAESGN